MRFAQQIHVCPGLPDAAAEAQRDLVVDDHPVIGQLEKVHLTSGLQLLSEGLLGDVDAHRGQLLTVEHWISDENNSAKTLHELAALGNQLSKPALTAANLIPLRYSSLRIQSKL
jgi:hypothetical protein